MKKRFLLPLLLFFLPAMIIDAAYAGFVYSNKVDTKTDSNSGKIDDVKPNFKLDENNYTIYFFPSMQAVDLNFNNDFSETNIKSAIDGENKDEWGYWTDSSYYPKKIETHGGPSISVEQFKTIDEPVTKQKDDNWPTAYTLQFSGWTADKAAAKNGYKSQGDYKYISAFDDLNKIDNESQDGTNPKDKVVFVYPIFTTGKDYNNDKKKNNVVQLTISKPDPNKPSSTIAKPRYLSRVEGAENTTYFYYKNLVIDKIESLSLSFAGLRRKGVWYSKWGSYTKNYIYKDGVANSVISEPGVYNLYAYLVRDKFDYNSALSSKFNTEISSNNFPLIYEDDLSKKDEFNVRLNESWLVGSTLDFWLFVKIEKVYEFRLAGTEGRGFAFDSAGQLYVSDFSSAKDGSLGGLWKMYYLDNVFMEKGKNNLFTEYTNSNGGKFKVRNTVFSFLSSDDTLTTISGIEPMKQAELDYVNANEPDENVKGNYKGVSTETESTYKKIKKEGVPPESADYSEYIKNPENLPNYAPSKDYVDYFFASEFKYSGFCKVLIKVDFATEDSPSEGKIKGKPTSIRVAVAPYLTNVHKVYVYPDGTDLVSQRDPGTKLIDPENNSFLKGIELTSFEMQAKDDYELKDQQITLRNNSTESSTSMLLSEYLSQYDVVDHLTNKKLEIGKSYKRHMACWQKTKTTK